MVKLKFSSLSSTCGVRNLEEHAQPMITACQRFFIGFSKLVRFKFQLQIFPSVVISLPQDLFEMISSYSFFTRKVKGALNLEAIEHQLSWRSQKQKKN